MIRRHPAATAPLGAIPIVVLFVIAGAGLVPMAGVAHAQSTAGPLTPAQVAVACAIPPMLTVPRAGGLQIAGGQATEPRTVFGRGDLLYINGGTLAGLQLGQQFFVRRSMTFGRPTSGPRAVRTSGGIRIVAVNDTTAVASIDFGCGEIMSGDYLDPFIAPSLPANADKPDTTGEPDFGMPGRVVFGRDEDVTGAPGDFMLIDRGLEQGVVPGSRLAVYRHVRTDGVPLALIGEAVVTAVGSTMAQIRVTQAQSSIESGDFVFPRKP